MRVSLSNSILVNLLSTRGRVMGDVHRLMSQIGTKVLLGREYADEILHRGLFFQAWGYAQKYVKTLILST